MSKKVISFSVSQESWDSVTNIVRALGISNSALIELLIQKTNSPKEKINQILKLEDKVKEEMKVVWQP